MCTVALTLANIKFKKQRGRADNVNNNTQKQPEGMPPLKCVLTSICISTNQLPADQDSVSALQTACLR